MADDSYVRDLAALDKRQRTYAEQVYLRLTSLPTDLRLVAMIPGLENRYGSFCDLDRDGDLDYVETEMNGAREEVRVFLRDAKKWRHGSSRSRGISTTHPLIPHVLNKAVRGRAAVVLPVARSPYLFLLEVGPGGDFQGKPKPLGQFLPRRLSRDRGIANNPYTIESVEDATKTTAAKIHGRMIDENDRQRQDVRFTLTLQEDGSVTSEVKQVPPGPDFGSIPRSFARVRSPADCEHRSDARGSIIASAVQDANGDGIDDYVLFSGVLSAHVFPGARKNDRITYGRELGSARDLPIEDLQTWFPVPLVAEKGERPYATKARSRLANIGWRLDAHRHLDATFTVRTEQHKAWFLNYYLVDRVLVPVMDYRSSWPHKEDHDPMAESYRQSVVLDADHDRSPDLLSVHVGSSFEWQRPAPNARAAMPLGHRRELDGGRMRCGIVHGLGERGDNSNRVLVQFGDDVKLPTDSSVGYPITVTKVPVYGRIGGRVRYCVLYRPRKLGLFFEVATISPDVARARQADAWRRRAERRLAMQPYYWACDEQTCTHDRPHHGEVFDDAIALFKRGLDHAESARDKAAVWRNVARVNGRAGRLTGAKRAYERFVMLARAVEPLDAPHPDLAQLFADEEFRALHAGWVKKLPLVRPGAF